MRPWTRRLGKLLASSLSACDHPFCATDLGDGDGNRGKPWAKPLRKPRDLLRPLLALENFVEKRARDSGQAVDCRGHQAFAEVEGPTQRPRLSSKNLRPCSFAQVEFRKRFMFD